MSSILIVDDDEICCMYLMHRLNAWGYRTHMVHSGEAAVQMAVQTLPDLILMDIYMPGSMDGIDAAKIIQSQIEKPVVFISGCSDHITVDKSVQCFPAGFLHKPVSVIQLYAVINIVLKNKMIPASSIIRQNPDTSNHQPDVQNDNSQRMNIDTTAHSFSDINIFSESTCNSNVKSQLEQLYLKEIVFPMIRKLSADGIHLSPAEIKVAALIRVGKSSKQLADILGVSVDTIFFHRKQIRKKIGLSSALNLETYLLEL